MCDEQYFSEQFFLDQFYEPACCGEVGILHVYVFLFCYNLVGKLHVNQSLVANIKEIERDYAEPHGGWVEKGGVSRPRHCRPLTKVSTAHVCYIAMLPQAFFLREQYMIEKMS